MRQSAEDLFVLLDQSGRVVSPHSRRVMLVSSTWRGVMRGVIGVLFYSVIALAPILAGVFIASRLLLDPRAPHRSRRSGGRHRVLGGWRPGLGRRARPVDGLVLDDGRSGRKRRQVWTFLRAHGRTRPPLFPLLCPAGWGRVRGRWVNHLEVRLRSSLCAPVVESRRPPRCRR